MPKGRKPTKYNNKTTSASLLPAIKTTEKNMYSVLVILAVVVAILLTLIVLIQESKGGGLASGFASANALAGVRKTTDFVEKATWTLAAALVVLAILTVYATPKADNAASVVTDMKTTTMPNLPGNAAPAAPAEGAAPAPQPAK